MAFIRWLLASRKAKLVIAALLLASGLVLSGAVTFEQFLDVVVQAIMVLIASIAVEDGLRGRHG